MTAPRVLIVGPSGRTIGGQQLQAADLVARLGVSGSVAVSFLPNDPSLPGALGRLQSIKYLRTIVNSALYLALLLIRVRRCEVVHVFSASHSSFLISTTPAVLVARLYGKRTVINYRSGGVVDHLVRWRRTALPVLRMADAIAVPSEWVARAFARHGLRTRLVRNAIEPSDFPFRERRDLPPVFLSNRHLSPTYNVECVLRAFALVQRRFADARLIVAGDGPERARLERLAGQLGLHHVRFVGWVTPGDMGEHYDAAEIYLNGSDVDAVPTSILEAFAAGLPVVTTDAGGTPSIAQHEATALVVARGDHEAMARCSLRLLEDAPLVARLTTNARRRSLAHDWESCCREWTALYDAVLRARPPRTANAPAMGVGSAAERANGGAPRTPSGRLPD